LNIAKFRKRFASRTVWFVYSLKIAMQNTFEILTGFLARYGADVEGREASPLPAEMIAQLKAFARGDLTEAEQMDLIRRLNERPDWIAFLAGEIKALRMQQGKKT
jgi:hypothetical protein